MSSSWGILGIIQKINPASGRLKTFRKFTGQKKKLNEQCVRVFASTNMNDGGLWKEHTNGRIAKVEGTPEHCFIFNEEVNGVTCPAILDKQWYINTAKSRLKDFGVTV